MERIISVTTSPEAIFSNRTWQRDTAILPIPKIYRTIIIAKLQIGFQCQQQKSQFHEEMNNRAASRAVSRIATPKNYAASPAFYIKPRLRMRGKLRGIPHPAKAG
jgi:hypothetical protein